MNKKYIWVYFIIFYALWWVKELWLVQYLDLMDPVSRAITSATIKIVIWVIPVILLVKFIEKSKPFSYLQLHHNFRKGLKWTCYVSLALIFYFLIINLIVLKNNIDFQIGINGWLNTILLVGITEEIVFRGFLLRKLMDSYRFWKANTITALLFVLIHFPIWFYKGLFEFPYILSSILTVFVLSIIFGFVYKKSNSLWSVIIIHSFYNLLVVLFN
ncbi:CPBP family intramembrane glutamic endopeptidase [Paenibacillus endoradicis]|uniref:CPBP family intramembrane glutamic endopeptidase n=1 Tax=Paenibacillus endoradicis TaxID=2972487 RepID=UPI00215920CC|nr:CPBP family intramembrane glutamic endopeptidase [Paenibacillus endoradicis]MCR8656876.1 CPBP family intramembrane metalloprotease [Paenibacillus endoradicis]